MELSRESMRAAMPARPEEGHKGTFGHLLVLAGSRGFTGAAKLVCEAAGRSGVGLVTAGIPYPLADILATSLTEAMTLRLPATKEETFAPAAVDPALKFVQDKDAVVLGPGLSRHPGTEAFVHGFVLHCPVPLVIDADGLNALSEQRTVMSKIPVPCILTPHPGEMARLLDTSSKKVQSDREATVKQLAKTSGCVVALKGHRTLIAGPEGQFAINTTGNNGLGTGGTGDVLAGLLGGLLAQGMSAFEAACLGVYLHGLAGDIAAERFTRRGMIASDVIHAIPDAWHTLES